MSKNITVDELAVMVAEGFAETATNEQVAKLHSDVDLRLTDVQKTLVRIENRLNAMTDRTLADHERRLAHLETERLRA